MNTYDPHRLGTVNGWCAHSECPILHPACEGIGVPVYGTRFEVELCRTCDEERKAQRRAEHERRERGAA